MASRARRVGVCERLLHEGDALREAARQGIRVTKMRGRDVKDRVHLGPAQLDGALERWNGLGDGAPAEAATQGRIPEEDNSRLLTEVPCVRRPVDSPE